jgi:hypothetical protein
MNKRSIWKLVSPSGEVLPPMEYSNHTTLEDVVNETFEALDVRLWMVVDRNTSFPLRLASSLMVTSRLCRNMVTPSLGGNLYVLA